MNVNKLILAGRLTRDIETRHTQGGMQIAKFGVAVNRKRRDEESVMFMDCVAFDKTAELIAKHLGKGDPLFIEGRLEFSTWESQDGSKRSKHECVVESFQFMGRGDEGGDKPGRRAGGERTTTSTKSEEPDYGDIPF